MPQEGSTFIGFIRPGYAKQDRQFTDLTEFGRFWLSVRNNKDAHNWVIVDRQILGFPRAPWAPRDRTTAHCVECNRWFVPSPAKFPGDFCQGCDAVFFLQHPSPTAKRERCPATDGDHVLLKTGKCMSCLKSKAEIYGGPAGAVEEVDVLLEVR